MLALYPQDMAKIGYLFLHQGRWEGKQIVSRAWIHQATQRQIETGTEEDYGYGWWVSRLSSDLDYYLASGRGGQRILVIPSLDIVLVTTGGGYKFDEIERYIQAAIGDLEKPLPANPVGVARLNAVVSDLASPPAAHPVSAFPRVASSISGQVFILEQPNPMEVWSLQLDFTNSVEATLRANEVSEANLKLVRIGLDGIYRKGDGEDPILARGEWIDDTTLVIDYAQGLGLDTYILRMQFKEDHLFMEINDISHGQNFSIEGQASN